MQIGKRCTICHENIESDDCVFCDVCGNSVHERCLEYEQTFECPRCADDIAIGSLEF